MKILRGEDVFLKLKVGNEFQKVEGAYITKFRINNQILKKDEISLNQWQEIKGIKLSSVTIDVSGIFTNSVTHGKLIYHALSGSVAKYKINFGNHHYILADFFITNYVRGGEVGELESFDLSLESSEEIEFRIIQ